MAYTKSILQWRDVTIEVNYDDDWLNGKSRGHQMAHVEVRSITPAKAQLPITETGYKSHFTHPDTVTDHGGAVALVKAWLDHEADTDKWRAYEASQRQLCLF